MLILTRDRIRGDYAVFRALANRYNAAGMHGHFDTQLPRIPLKLTILSAWALLGVFAGSTAAAQSDHSFLATEADTGGYAVAAFGRSSEQIDVGSATQAAPYKVSGNALGLQLGAGYRPVPAWSSEASYVRLGRVSSGRSRATVDGLMLSALGYLPTPLLSLYGRIGILDARSYGVYGSPPALHPGLIHHHDSNLAFGIGLSTNFQGRLNFRLESQGFHITHATNTSLVTLAFVWSFL